MNVQRICFLGTRTGNFEATSTLFRDVLGLHNVHTEAGWCGQTNCSTIRSCKASAGSSFAAQMRMST